MRRPLPTVRREPSTYEGIEKLGQYPPLPALPKTLMIFFSFPVEGIALAWCKPATLKWMGYSFPCRVTLGPIRTLEPLRVSPARFSPSWPALVTLMLLRKRSESDPRVRPALAAWSEVTASTKR